MISDKPGVRQDEELESHLNKGQFVVESTIAGFVPLQFCLCFFLISRLYQPSKSWLTLEMGLFTYSVYRTCI
jgi:hypothetical protein